MDTKLIEKLTNDIQAQRHLVRALLICTGSKSRDMKRMGDEDPNAWVALNDECWRAREALNEMQREYKNRTGQWLPE